VPTVVLGVVLLLAALVIRAPATILQKILPATASAQVDEWGGSLWQGQALVKTKEKPVLVEWQLHPLALLTGKLAAGVQSKGALPLQGDVVLGFKQWQVKQLQGELPSALIQPFLPAGWELPGSIHIERLLITKQGLKQGPWLEGQGSLRWQGGAMKFSLNGQAQQATLPPLRVEISKENNDLLLTLNEAAGTLAGLRLMADGQIETQLRERLLRYSPGYHSSGNPPDAVVVTAKQAL
jgi:general secretion pathway protein N